MANRVDIMLVGRTHLGAALRAALLGIVLTWVIGWFIRSGWQAAVLAAILACIIIPVAYWISSRDNPEQFADPQLPPDKGANPPDVNRTSVPSTKSDPE